MSTPLQETKNAAEQAARAEAAPTPVRRSRAVLFQVALLGAVSAFAMLTFLIKTTPLLPVDVQITRAIQSVHLPWVGILMNVISWPGFPPQTFIIPVVLVLLIYAFGLHWESVAALSAAIISGASNELIKLLIQRPRPTADLVQVFAALNSYSFPSGHVMFYVTFFGFLWFLLFILLKHSWQRTLLLVLLSIPILLVGVSRIYLGEHWASDVLGAYLLGSLALTASILFYRWDRKRFSTQQPVAPHNPGTG